MLFNSVEFIFVFLPLVLAGFFASARLLGQGPALAWLTLASLGFYAWWNPAWLPLLLASIAANLLLGRRIAREAAGSRQAKAWLVFGLAANLALLVHYKYADFLAGALSQLMGGAAVAPVVELPLGISFFTFTQIAFLVDVHQRKAADFDPVRYGLFVTYYPHLIAGPILHHRDMMPQFERADIFRFSAQRLADGIAIFVLGLFKKVVLADAFGRFAGPAFAAAATQPPSFFEAWGAALCYTFQLYFDFSGYSDMAIGLALMIGVSLPVNFLSPYKARSIAEFWRCWHMTLSRFLRDYLYIPLGGNRRGPLRRKVNLLITMVLGGLWHGAGWTFLAWGALHGVLLVIHQAWRSLVPHLPALPDARWARAGAATAAWALTFVCVVVGWVFFRSTDMGSALSMLRGMAGLHGSLLPQQLIDLVPALGWVADGMGKVPLLADGTVMGAVELFVMLALGFALVLCTPALSELSPRTRLLLVVPCAALALQRVFFGRASEFLYFQF